MSAIPVVGQDLPSWMVLAAGLLAWVAFLWIVTRIVFRGHERVRCPLTGRMARVTFVRGPDGGREDIVRCSLQPGGIVCDRSCRAPTTTGADRPPPAWRAVAQGRRARSFSRASRSPFGSGRARSGA